MSVPFSLGSSEPEDISQQSLPVEVPVIVPDTLEALQAQTSPYDDPIIRALMQQVAELTARLDALAETKVMKVALVRDKREAKEAYIKLVNEHLVHLETDVREADRELKSLEQEAYMARRLKDSIQGKINETLAAMKAREALEEANQRWQEMRDAFEFTWVKDIMQHQLEAVKYGVEAFESDLHGFGIFDQMGLGKTLEAAAIIDVLQVSEAYSEVLSKRVQHVDFNKPESISVLWLCPTSIKESTVRELKKWGKTNVVKLQGDATMRNNVATLARDMGLILVVGYEQLRDRKGLPVTPQLLEHEWPIVVMDEAHRFKNDKGSTFERIEQICERAGFIIPMTGTPILNRPDELWSILHMLTMKGKYRGKFYDKNRFLNEYCSVWGKKVRFYGNSAERLVRDVKDMVIRRRKDEVLNLPPKMPVIERLVTFGEKQAELYDMMRDQFLIWLNEQESEYVAASNVLAQLSYLRQIALYPAGVTIRRKGQEDMMLDCDESAKLDEAMEVIQELLENDEKVLLYANFNAPIRELCRRINEKAASGDEDWTYKGQPVRAEFIIGGQTDDSKANKQERFNDPENPMAVLVGNITAMGLGLNLQEVCSTGVFLDLYWNPGINEQAEDRLHRQGQKNPVTIIQIKGENCVDGYIDRIIADKADLINGVIERKELRRMIDDGLI